MRKLIKIFDFYISSNTHVAIATACFVWITSYHFSGKIIDHSAVFAFFSTILAYQFIRIFENTPLRAKAFIKRIKKQTSSVLFINLVSLIGVSYYGLKIGLSNFWVLVPSLFITIGYAIPFFKINDRLCSLRTYPSIKIFSIALVWSIHTVIFPLQEQLYDPQVWLLFIQRFFLVIVLTIPFDIRDMSMDSPFLQTLPQKIGVLNSKKTGVFYLTLFLFLSFLKQPFSTYVLLSDIIIFVSSLIFLVLASEYQSKYYASFWVESVPVLGIAVIYFFFL